MLFKMTEAELDIALEITSTFLLTFNLMFMLFKMTEAELDIALEITSTFPLTFNLMFMLFKMTEAELQEMTMALINDDSIFDIDEPPAPMDRAKEPV